MKPVVLLRPPPGLADTLAAARSLGLAPIASPLFAIEPVRWTAPEPGRFDAILAGSANAFRQGGAALDRLTALPVHAVGERTAHAARTAGFTVASVGRGGLQEVAARLMGPMRLLRLAGADRTVLALPPGVSMTECVVYRAQPQALGEPAIAALRSGALALLHSGAAARQFAAECARLPIDRQTVTLVALAPRIAAVAGDGWQAVAVAPEASDGALLALAAGMCH